MLQNVNLRCVTAWVLLSCSFSSASAAELSPAERVETSPGLSPDAVRQVFNKQRQELAGCLRLIAEVPQPELPARYVPWTAPTNADDRVRFRFVVNANGTVAMSSSYSSTMEVRGSFIDVGCAEGLARRWTFPSFEGEPPVEVSVWARFRSTEAERKAALASIHESLGVICQALSAVSPGDKPPSQEVWSAALARLLSERGPSLDRRIQGTLSAMTQVHVTDSCTILSNAMEELAAKDACPKLRAWAKY